MDVRRFDYELPPRFIAQRPVSPRDSSRLLVLERKSGAIRHCLFRDLPDLLRPPDLLVVNETRVLPARLSARKETGGRVEITLLQPLDAERREWTCQTRGSRVRSGHRLRLNGNDPALVCEVLDAAGDGVKTIRCARPLDGERLEQLGSLPLPPYIKGYAGPQERYQTIYARQAGSVAAPTAGLHFTPALMAQLEKATAGFSRLTLHVGLDTFAPVRSSQVEGHGLQGELAEITQQCARAVRQARAAGGRIVSVGTTSTRTLEWAASRRPDPAGSVPALRGLADLYIYPGHAFRVVDVMITNLHLPRSTPMFMVSAFIGAAHADADAGRRLLLEAYAVAKREGYRFYSFGDAMLIL